MATSLKSFSIETQVALTDTDLIITIAGESVFIGKATFTNTSALPVVVTVWRLNSGTATTTGSGGNWLKEITIQPGRTTVCDEVIGHVLGGNMKLTAQASVVDVVNADVSGAVES